MANDDYYRRQAADAQAQAERSISDIDKTAWLRLAQSWMEMIQKSVPSQATVDRAQHKSEQQAEQKFADATEAQDTHQKRSDESH
jgi:hypothetical protein